jgi:hypothetical protein
MTVGVPRQGVVLTLVTRAYCHLCDEMRDALAPLLARYGATLVEVDVDSDPALESAWGEFVPVLLAGGADRRVELCHYHLDRARVEAAMRAGQSQASAGDAARRNGRIPL